jgi:ATP-binding cassette subfamily C (CFTR/MRP) protein 4
VLQEKELHPEDEEENVEEVHDSAGKKDKDTLVNRRESDGTLYKVEARQQGVVKLSTYKEYWAADHGWTPLIVVFFMVIMAQVISIVTDWFLSYWVQLDESDRNEDTPVIIFSILVVVFCVFSFVRGVYFFNAAVRSARHLHDSMFYAVVQTRILFFDTNPVGRILNRFSKDIGLLDDTLASTYFDFVQVCRLVDSGTFSHSCRIYFRSSVLFSSCPSSIRGFSCSQFQWWCFSSGFDGTTLLPAAM